MTDAAKLRIARMFIGGQWRDHSDFAEIKSPYSGAPVGKCAISTPSDLEDALASAREGAETMAALPGYERANYLEAVAGNIVAHREELAQILSLESGKAISDARGEIDRAADTFKLSAGEAVRIEGRHVPLDSSAMGAGKMAFLLRVPVGVVAAITPFNAPVNLTAHKLAPALAAGNSVVLKPAPQTPFAVTRMIELMVDAGLPKGALNVVFGGREIGERLVSSPIIDFVTFTGSSAAGADIKARSGLRRVALELGGNGVTIVHDDADLEVASSACARNSMRLAGQSCISVQTVCIHRRVYDRFVELLVSKVGKLRLGDPMSNDTDVGTLIDEAAAVRVESWVQEAVEAGANLLAGGKRRGAAVEPTVLTRVSREMKVVCDEVFGPVLSVMPYDDISEPIGLVNSSRYGLQCGIFSDSSALTIQLAKKLKTGGVIINGTSTWRTDQLAYGGVRDSGIGREGPRYAIQDMTDERLILFNY